jgi:hypothetical protein
MIHAGCDLISVGMGGSIRRLRVANTGAWVVFTAETALITYDHVMTNKRLRKILTDLFWFLMS